MKRSRVTAQGFNVENTDRRVEHAEDQIEEFKSIASGLFNKTKDYFNFKCDLAGEIKVGSNWSETH